MELSSRWRAILLKPAAAGSVIRGLGFSEFSPHWTEDQLAMLVNAAPDSVIENNTFVRSATRALGVFAANVRVEGNTVDDNGGSGGAVNRAHGSVFRDNTFDRNNNAHFAVATCGAYCTMAGTKVAHTKDVVVDQNSFAGNDGTGFWCDLGCTNGQITGNTVSGNSNNGIFWEVSSTATIQDNIMTGNSFAAATSLLMDTNRTTQVAAPAMFATVGGNQVSGRQTINWCPSGCTSYSTLAALRTATGIDFGAAG